MWLWGQRQLSVLPFICFCFTLCSFTRTPPSKHTHSRSCPLFGQCVSQNQGPHMALLSVWGHLSVAGEASPWTWWENSLVCQTYLRWVRKKKPFWLLSLTLPSFRCALKDLSLVATLPVALWIPLDFLEKDHASTPHGKWGVEISSYV